MSGEPPKKPLRVAILEDEWVLRDALAEVLSRHDFAVTTSSTTADLLSSVAEQQTDIAIVDLVLADGEDGWEAIERLHQHFPSTRVVVLSGHLSEETTKKGYELGAVGLLDKKSLSSTMLATLLQSVAAGECFFPVTLGLTAPTPNGTPKLPSALQQLTPREREVIRYVAGGADNSQIAESLSITERTVRAHVSALYRKLGANNRTQLALSARRLGVIPRERVDSTLQDLDKGVQK